MAEKSQEIYHHSSASCVIELTGKCFSASLTSFTSEAFGSSNDIATIFQSSSPSSIMANAAKGLTLRTSPIFLRLSPISMTSTTDLQEFQKHFVAIIFMILSLLLKRFESTVVSNDIPGSLSPNAPSTSEFAKDGSSHVCGSKPQFQCILQLESVQNICFRIG